MSESIKQITVVEVSVRIDQYCVVDVREPAEYVGELGHIEGSVLLPLGELDRQLAAGATRSELFAGAATGPDAPLLMVCRSGARSGKACERLAQAGFLDATNLQGGMLEWNSAGLPTVTASGSAADGGRD